MLQKIKTKDLFIIILVMMVWGINNVAVKYLLEELDPFLFLSMRFFLLGLLLSFFYFPDKRHFRAVFMVAIFLGLGHFGLWVFGAQGVDAATAAIAAQLSAPFGLILAYLILQEKITLTQIMGIVVAFCGILVISGEPKTSSPLFLMLIIGSAFFAAVNNVFLNREKKHKNCAYNFMSLLTGMSILVAPVFCVCSLIYETSQIQQLTHMSAMVWNCFFYTVFLTTIFGYVSWMKIVSKYEVSRICYFPLLQPVFALIFGCWFLHEGISVFKLLGGVLIIAGILIININGILSLKNAPLRSFKAGI